MNLVDQVTRLKENGTKTIPLSTLLFLCKANRVSVTPEMLKTAKSKAELVREPGNKAMQNYQLTSTAALKLAESWTKVVEKPKKKAAPKKAKAKKEEKK
jgi:hypothetical protein